MNKILTLLFLLGLIRISVFGQANCKDLIRDEKSTKNDIVASFNAEYSDIEIERFEAMQLAINNKKNLKRTGERSKKTSVNTWKPLGPVGSLNHRGNEFGGAAGRIDRLRFHPFDKAIMYACSPGGGLWKTKDAGNTWVSLTDFTEVTGVSDILIHPEHPDTLFLATGESDSRWMNGSVGVLKSVDGGHSWLKTGLELPLSKQIRIQRLIMHPAEPNIMYAGTNVGIYLTEDGGDTWSKINSDLHVWNMELNPGNPNIIYVAAFDGFYKSNDAGNNFQKISNGLPSENFDRVDLGVSKSDPDVVYAMFKGKHGSNCLQGFYKSDNSGDDFSLVYNEKNLFWWDENQLTAGIGGWEMAVSDVDANRILVGGIHNWRSKDGGKSWQRVGAQDSTYVLKHKWTHCDVHFLTFFPGDANTYFSCNDGGIYKTSNDGDKWEILNGNLAVFLTSTIANSALTENKIIAGTQDNSCVYFNGDSCRLFGTGDGQQCFFDKTNDSIMYVTSQRGWTSRSDDGGLNWTEITNKEAKTSWLTPFMQHPDPIKSSTIYQAGQKIFKSENRGSSWQAVGSLETENPFYSMDICESHPSVIWAVESSTSNIYRLEGEIKYEQFNNPSEGGISRIIAHPDDPKRAYVTINDFNPESKVYETKDGGKTWLNLSDGLPGIPVNCIYYLRGSDDRIYVGLNVGFYYRDNTSGGWVQMDEGLPHSEILDIGYFYPTNKLRVAVYGRGIWEYDNAGHVMSKR